jgi:arylsulfatase A-like enzyme
MMVMGPGVRQGAIVDRLVESVDLAPTLGSLLGFPVQLAKGKPLPEVV